MMVSPPDSARIRARKRLELLGVVRGRARHRIRGPLPQQPIREREMKVRLIQFGIGLAAPCSFWRSRSIGCSWERSARLWREANPLWAAAAMLIYAVNLALRAWRWQVILRPVAAIPYPIVTRALLVGYGLNAVMPARLGELFVLNSSRKLLDCRGCGGLTSIVIERLFDGITVICCLGAGLLFAAAAKPNTGLLVNVLVTGSVLFGAVLLAAFYISSSMMSRIVGRFPGLSAPDGNGAARVGDPANLADIGGHRAYSHHICDGCALLVVSGQGGRNDARVFRHAGPPRRGEPEHARAVRPGLSRHIAISPMRLRSNSPAALGRSASLRQLSRSFACFSPCADRRRHFSPRLGGPLCLPF